MRLSRILYRQHIDRMFKKHWIVQGQKTPIETGAEQHLKALGIPIIDANEVVKEVRKTFDFNIVGYRPPPVKFDETHPDWHDKVCYLYRNNNVLLLGEDQAKNITNTVEIDKNLPHNIENIQLTPEQNEKIRNIILSSHVYDTEQKKLPIRKDPLRPAWVFPRDYGITHHRRCLLMLTRLIQFCENESDSKVSDERIVLDDVNVSVPFVKKDDRILFESCTEHLLLSKKPLKNLTNNKAEDLELNNITPVHFTNTLVPENIYKFDTNYPLQNYNSKYHPHTVFFYYDITKVQNLYEEEVTETQILGRSLMKTFATASAYARAKYGNDVMELPEPVTLQCVHTDGKLYHFAALQLNTLDLDSNGVKNIWYTIPRIPLFGVCEYQLGKPVLEEYNPNVVKYLLAFYNNN